jgi:hypothetical protein
MLPPRVSQELFRTNAAGFPMKLGSATLGPDASDTYYCGRHLGTELIPGSDGRCGPDSGPQCRDCSRAQQQLLEEQEGQKKTAEVQKKRTDEEQKDDEDKQKEEEQEEKEESAGPTSTFSV